MLRLHVKLNLSVGDSFWLFKCKTILLTICSTKSTWRKNVELKRPTMTPEEEALLLIVAVLLIRRRRRLRQKRRRKGRMWARPHVRQREEVGAFDKLMPELRQHESDMFVNVAIFPKSCDVIHLHVTKYCVVIRGGSATI